MVLRHDKVVLRAQLSFLPKVVSTFHLNHDIVLPSLEVVCAIGVYLKSTATIQQSDSLCTA